MPDPQPGPFSGFPPRPAAQSVVTLPSAHQTSQDWSIQSSHARSSAKPYGASASGDKQRDQGWAPSGASGGPPPPCLAKVTPLPVHTQHYLEGVWSVHRVSRSSHHHYAQVAADADRESVWSDSLSSGMVSPLTSVSSPTSQAQSSASSTTSGSAAASFFIRHACTLRKGGVPTRRLMALIQTAALTMELAGPRRWGAECHGDSKQLSRRIRTKAEQTL
ncbi:uncharacterized protein LOC143110285 [Alosa pseudoharengus]|uniref:uncharacterized protein LOC143110285 n=1 Tax=Alosa pseudoharengus TaxID=34774 RepID=UPI003F89CD1E